MVINASCQHAVISNAGRCGKLNMSTFNKHSNGLIGKCFEIPHYSYRHPLPASVKKQHKQDFRDKTIENDFYFACDYKIKTIFADI